MEKEKIDEILKKIRSLVNDCNYEDALDICRKRSLLKVEEIQVERLYILTKKLDNYTAAFDVWKYFQDINNVDIVIKGIDILMNLNMLDEAYEYSNKYEFLDPRFAYIKAKLLMRMKKYNEAKEICNDPRYASEKGIQDIKRRLKKFDHNSHDNISVVLTKIYASDITVSEIDNEEIDDFNKIILKLAYYDKNNAKAGLKYLKEIKGTLESVDARKIINKIEQKLLSKKGRYFDITTYTDILGRTIDFRLVDKINEKKKEKDKSIVNLEVNEDVIDEVKSFEIKKDKEIKKVKKEVKYISSGEGKTINRYTNMTNNDNTKSLLNNRDDVPLIKDILRDEINDLGKFLYSRMYDPSTRKNAVIAWDNLYCLKNKKVTDKESLNKIIHIIKVVSESHPEIVDADIKKLTKIVKKYN